MGPAFIAPAVYKHSGYIENTDVLYNHEVLFGITRTMAAIGLAGAALSDAKRVFIDIAQKCKTGINFSETNFPRNFNFFNYNTRPLFYQHLKA